MRARGSSARVLLIEDNSGDAFLIQRSLKESGIPAEIEHCTDGEAAMRRIGSMTSSAVPDAVILDLALPRVDGLDVLRSIFSRPALVGVPVMVFTSSPSPSDRHRAELLGQVSYVRKPTGVDEFLRVVAQNVSRMLSGNEPGTRQSA